MIGDPVLDYNGLSQYDNKLKNWIASADSNIMHRTGNETIAGTKTFTSPPVVPTPTNVAPNSSQAVPVSFLYNNVHLSVYIDGTNISTEFYVDGSTGNDSTGDGSQSAPWKTISHAAQVVSSDYNINSKTVHINVAGGTYTNNIDLLPLTATSGSVVIRPAGENDTVTISHSARTGATINHTGGEWVLQDLNIVVVIANNDIADNRIRHGIRSAASQLTIQHCNLSFVDENTGYTTALYCLLVPTGGNMRILNNDGDAAARTATWSGTKGSQTSVSWLLSTGGVFQLFLKKDPDIFDVSGTYSFFCRLQGGKYNTIGAGSPPTFNPVDSPTGKRYAITAGGQCVTGLSDPNDVATYFPGSTAGTVERETDSWISPAFGNTFSSTPIYSVTLAEDIPVGGTDGRYTIPFSTPVSAIAFKIVTPASASAVTFYLRVTYNNTSKTEPMFTVPNFVNTSEQVTIGFIKNDHGINSMLISHGATSASHVVTEMHTSLNYVGSAQMTEMSLAATSSVLPAGTTITVYGATEV